MACKLIRCYPAPRFCQSAKLHAPSSTTRKTTKNETPWQAKPREHRQPSCAEKLTLSGRVSWKWRYDWFVLKQKFEPSCSLHLINNGLKELKSVKFVSIFSAAVNVHLIRVVLPFSAVLHGAGQPARRADAG